MEFKKKNIIETIIIIIDKLKNNRTKQTTEQIRACDVSMKFCVCISFVLDFHMYNTKFKLMLINQITKL